MEVEGGKFKRTDTETRFKSAFALLLEAIIEGRENNSAFSREGNVYPTEYISLHANLDDEGVPKFMEQFMATYPFFVVANTEGEAAYLFVPEKFEEWKKSQDPQPQGNEPISGLSES